MPTESSQLEAPSAAPAPPDAESASVAPTPASAGRPLVEMLTIAGPTVGAMVSYTAMQFTDKLIVSRIGPDPIYVGAQGNGGLAAFVPISIAMGMLTVVNTYVAQHLGAGRPERGPAYAWNGLWIAGAFWALVLLPWAAVLPRVFAAAGVDPAQGAMATEYGRILVIGSIITMWTRGLSQFFYGMHRAGVVLAAGLTANLVNLFLDWVLVFGKLGMPALGVAGSAYATVIATCVELAIPAALFLGPTLHAQYRTRSAWRPSRRHLAELLRLGWPGGAMFGNEMICWGYFMVHLVSRFGAEHATAGWIAHQYMSLSFMPAVGVSVACTALVGKYMGMGRPDLAVRRARLGIGVALAYMGLCAVLFVVLRGPMVRLFIDAGTPPDAVERLVRLGSAFLIATAAFQVFDAIAMTVSGSLRGAGDTVVPGLFTIAASWVVIVGGGSAMVRFVPGLGSIGPWIAAASYIAILGVFLLARFAAGRWKSIRLVGGVAAAGTR